MQLFVKKIFIGIIRTQMGFTVRFFWEFLSQKSDFKKIFRVFCKRFARVKMHKKFFTFLPLKPKRTG